MPMEGLLALVEKIRERIDSHGTALRQSEALTRYALIDPMLRELGWDTSDPEVVIPEYSVAGSGRADYALLSGGKLIMVVEVKKLDVSLEQGAEQAFRYLNRGAGEKARYFATTNGSRWEIYDTSKPATEMSVASIDLKGPSAAEASLQALSLWRPSVISGSVQPGKAPVVGLHDDTTDLEPPPPEPDWKPISTLRPVPGSGEPPPSEILFPDNSLTSIRAWVGVTEAIVRWLMEKGFLTAAHCPIQRGENYVLATSPTHPNGQPMRYKEINSLYLNRNYSSSNQIRSTRRIIEHVGQDPSQFKVRFP